MFKTIKIKGGMDDSTVMVGESLINLGKYIPVEKTVIITDKNVAKIAGTYKPNPTAIPTAVDINIAAAVVMP